ncbi:E3 ubiquitin-protein ligase rnf8 [Gonapodya sp. JEL0774]|nr:E3 ubiquitin-protein ligase rnf8 [Gonapodya sp. JEL0774]
MTSLSLTLKSNVVPNQAAPRRITLNAKAQFCSIGKQDGTVETAACSMFPAASMPSVGPDVEPADHDILTAVHLGRFEPQPPAGFVGCCQTTATDGTTQYLLHSHPVLNPPSSTAVVTGSSSTIPSFPVADSAFFVNLVDTSISRNHCSIKAIPVHELSHRTAQRLAAGTLPGGSSDSGSGTSDTDTDHDELDDGNDHMSGARRNSMNRTFHNGRCIPSRREVGPLRTGDVIVIGGGDPNTIPGGSLENQVSSFVYTVAIDGQRPVMPHVASSTSQMPIVSSTGNAPLSTFAGVSHPPQIAASSSCREPSLLSFRDSRSISFLRPQSASGGRLPGFTTLFGEGLKDATANASERNSLDAAISSLQRRRQARTRTKQQSVDGLFASGSGSRVAAFDSDEEDEAFYAFSMTNDSEPRKMSGREELEVLESSTKAESLSDRMKLRLNSPVSLRSMPFTTSNRAQAAGMASSQTKDAGSCASLLARPDLKRKRASKVEIARKIRLDERDQEEDERLQSRSSDSMDSALADHRRLNLRIAQRSERRGVVESGSISSSVSAIVIPDEDGGAWAGVSDISREHASLPVSLSGDAQIPELARNATPPIAPLTLEPPLDIRSLQSISQSAPNSTLDPKLSQLSASTQPATEQTLEPSLSTATATLITETEPAALEQVPPSASVVKANPLIDVLRQHMECVVCCDWLIVPKFLPCGHGFCGPCITSWLERNASCPTCREGVQVSTSGNYPLSENVSVRDMLHSTLIPELLRTGEMNQQKMEERKEREEKWKKDEAARVASRLASASSQAQRPQLPQQPMFHFGQRPLPPLLMVPPNMPGPGQTMNARYQPSPAHLAGMQLQQGLHNIQGSNIYDAMRNMLAVATGNVVAASPLLPDVRVPGMQLNPMDLRTAADRTRGSLLGRSAMNQGAAAASGPGATAVAAAASDYLMHSHSRRLRMRMEAEMNRAKERERARRRRRGIGVGDEEDEDEDEEDVGEGEEGDAIMAPGNVSIIVSYEV